MNNVSLVGRVTYAGEIQTTSNDKKYIKFGVAVQRRGASKDTADFINCIAWDRKAGFIHTYFKKGTPISVIGRLQVNQYTTTDGKKMNDYSVLAEEVSFVPTYNGESNTKVTEEPKEQVHIEDTFAESDLPFEL